MEKAIVLVLDTNNSARSQMAEALIRKYANHRYEVYSAGTQPKGIHPLAVKAMNEIGVDISSQRSKSVNEYLGILPVGYLITLSKTAEKNAPSSWPNVLDRMDWPMEDPTSVEGSDEEKLAKFRATRDQIDAKVKEWLRV